MMIKLRCTYLFLIIVTLSCNYPAFCMYNSLCLEEKEIFVCIVNHVGLPLIVEKLNQARASDILCITLRLYLTEINDNSLTKLIAETITAREKMYGYRPYSIKKHKDTLTFTSKANNYLGAYTRYWHALDKNGPHIKCVSTFTNIEALEEVIAQIKESTS